MAMEMFSIELAALACAGIMSHLCYFIRGEQDLSAPIIVRAYIVLEAVYFFLHVKFTNWSTLGAVLAASLGSFAYFSSLLSSIVIYRVFFHQLRNFPGPCLASMTKLYHMWSVRACDQYRFLHKLHIEYGDYVRTGPNEITLFVPEAVQPVLGSNTPCTKSVWWDMMLPEVAMVTTRSVANHDWRRRAWDMGFSVKALQSHESRIFSHAQRLETLIAGQCDQPVNVTKNFEYYTFDVMGDIHFGVKFDMLKRQQYDPAVTVFKGGQTLFGPFTPVPWLFHIATSIPGLQRDWFTYRSWADEKLKTRLSRYKDEKSGLVADVESKESISWVVEQLQDQKGLAEDVKYRWLLGDFVTLMSAATEPVLCTLVFLVYHLALSPHATRTLRKELDSVEDLSSNGKLQALPYLNALISETLRLHPAVPSAGLRSTPPEGLMIGKTLIPGGTTVLVPQYSLGRRPDCYDRPDEFCPERWCSKPEMILNQNGFVPFGAGNYTCLGSKLALMEIRLAVAILISKYDVSLAEDEDGIEVSEKLRDLFVATPGPLNLVFRKRDEGRAAETE